MVLMVSERAPVVNERQEIQGDRIDARSRERAGCQKATPAGGGPGGSTGQLLT